MEAPNQLFEASILYDFSTFRIHTYKWAVMPAMSHRPGCSTNP